MTYKNFHFFVFGLLKAKEDHDCHNWTGSQFELKFIFNVEVLHRGFLNSQPNFKCQFWSYKAYTSLIILCYVNKPC